MPVPEDRQLRWVRDPGLLSQPRQENCHPSMS